MESGLIAPLLAEAVRRAGRRQPLALSGLAGAGKGWLVAALAEAAGRPLAVITESLDSAEKLLQETAFFPSEKPARIFPHWETMPYDNFSPQVEGLTQRMEALVALTEGERPVLVVTAQALMQGTIPLETLAGLRFTVEAGRTYARRELLARLAAAGYVRVDLVEAAALPHLKMQYHRRSRLSRPSSGWDRVVRQRYDHQTGKTQNLTTLFNL